LLRWISCMRRELLSVDVIYIVILVDNHAQYCRISKYLIFM
jgi:hypothetical protein